MKKSTSYSVDEKRESRCHFLSTEQMGLLDWSPLKMGPVLLIGLFLVFFATPGTE